jgi:hypothetical protein
VNHTAEFNRRKSEDEEALRSGQLNLFCAARYLKILLVMEELEHVFGIGLLTTVAQYLLLENVAGIFL